MWALFEKSYNVLMDLDFLSWDYEVSSIEHAKELPLPMELGHNYIFF